MPCLSYSSTFRSLHRVQERHSAASEVAALPADVTNTLSNLTLDGTQTDVAADDKDDTQKDLAADNKNDTQKDSDIMTEVHDVALQSHDDDHEVDSGGKAQPAGSKSAGPVRRSTRNKKKERDQKTDQAAAPAADNDIQAAA